MQEPDQLERMQHQEMRQVLQAAAAGSSVATQEQVSQLQQVHEQRQHLVAPRHEAQQRTATPEAAAASAAQAVQAQQQMAQTQQGPVLRDGPKSITTRRFFHESAAEHLLPTLPASRSGEVFENAGKN